MLESACYLGVSVALTSSVAQCVWVFSFFQCNICLHFFHLSADEVFPVDRGLVKSILSFPGTESWAWLQHSTVLWQRLAKPPAWFHSFTPLLLCSPSLDDILAWFDCWFDTTVEQIVAVYHSASKQKAWDHFTKAQRKNISVWCKQAEVGNFLLC